MPRVVPVEQTVKKLEPWLQQVARECRERRFIDAGTFRAAVRPGVKELYKPEVWHSITTFLLT